MNLVMQLIIATSAVLLLPWSVRGVDGQQSSTRQNNATTDDPNVIELAGVFDITAYDWGPDVFEVAVQFINEGRWGNLLPPGTRVEYSLEDTDCDQTTAVRSYWKIRTENGDRPPHGVVGVYQQLLTDYRVFFYMHHSHFFLAQAVAAREQP